MLERAAEEPRGCDRLFEVGDRDAEMVDALGLHETDAYFAAGASGAQQDRVDEPVLDRDSRCLEPVAIDVRGSSSPTPARRCRSRRSPNLQRFAVEHADGADGLGRAGLAG